MNEDGLWKCEKCEKWKPPASFAVKGRGRLYVCLKCEDKEGMGEQEELEEFLDLTCEGDENKVVDPQ